MKSKENILLVKKAYLAPQIQTYLLSESTTIICASTMKHIDEKGNIHLNGNIEESDAYEACSNKENLFEQPLEED